MTHKNVESALGRLATDPELRRRFAADPQEVLADLARQGLELSAVEAAALAATDVEALRQFTQALDRRLRKADAATLNPSPDQEEVP
jgi:hypothetical protein